MSLAFGANFLNRDAVTVKSLTQSRGAGGFMIRSATTAARGTNPTSITCRMMEIDVEEAAKYGLHGAERHFKLLASSNPSLTVQDYVTWTDPDGVTHTDMRVVVPSRNVDSQGFYVAVCEEATARESSVATA